MFPARGMRFTDDENACRSSQDVRCFSTGKQQDAAGQFLALMVLIHAQFPPSLRPMLTIGKLFGGSNSESVLNR